MTSKDEHVTNECTFSSRRTHLLMWIDGHTRHQFEMSIYSGGILSNNALRHNLVQKFKDVTFLHHGCKIVVAKIRRVLGSLNAVMKITALGMAASAAPARSCNSRSHDMSK